MKRRLEKSRSADVVISRLIMTNLPATDAGASMFSSHGASTAVACAPVRALVWHGPRQMAVESVAEPRPGDGEVLVAPEAVGICGSEVEGYVGRMANRVPPLVMGHEFAGTIGLFALHAARAAGIADVRVVEPFAERRAFALAAGARSALADAGALARERSADLVIDAVGAGSTRRAALDAVRPGGVVVLLGLHEDETALPFHRVIRDQIALQGSFAYTDAEFALALDLLASGKVGLGALGRTQPLEAGPEVFAILAAGPTAQLKTFLSAHGS